MVKKQLPGPGSCRGTNRAALALATAGVLLWIPGCVLPAIAIRTWFWGIEEPVSLVYGLRLLVEKNILLAVIVALLGLGAPVMKWWTLFREARGGEIGVFHAWAAKFASIEIVAAAFLLVCAKFGTAGGDAFTLPGLYFLIAAWACGVASTFVMRKTIRASEHERLARELREEAARDAAVAKPPALPGFVKRVWEHKGVRIGIALLFIAGCVGAVYGVLRG